MDDESPVNEAPPRPAAWWVPPISVGLFVGGFAFFGQFARDKLQNALIFAFAVIPAALLYVAAYGLGYLLLRNRQLSGRWPQHGGLLVCLAALIGVLGLCGLFLLMTVR